MRRGTTPTHIFETTIDLRGAVVLFMTYNQGKKTIVEKTIDDIEVAEDKLTIKLTQEETLAFDLGKNVQIQCRAKFEDENAIASDILDVRVCDILKEGEI